MSTPRDFYSIERVDHHSFSRSHNSRPPADLPPHPSVGATRNRRDPDHGVFAQMALGGDPNDGNAHSQPRSYHSESTSGHSRYPPTSNYELHHAGSPSAPSSRETFGVWGNHYPSPGSSQPFQAHQAITPSSPQTGQYYSTSRRGNAVQLHPHGSRPSQANIPPLGVFDTTRPHQNSDPRYHGGVFNSSYASPQTSSGIRPHIPPAVPYDTSPSPPPSPTSHLNVTSSYGGHSLRKLRVSDADRARFITFPTRSDQGWRIGFLKCNYPGCTSPPMEQSRVETHLAHHLYDRKTHECSCGTRFGRHSEANRHIEDQRPCEKCGESRRKHKGTNMCSRCYPPTSGISRRPKHNIE